MKNNIITSSQFYCSMFLCSLISLLFIDGSSSPFLLLYFFIGIIINMLFISIYNGKRAAVLSVVLWIYFAVISTAAVVRLCEYMHLVLNSGEYWSIAVLLLITAYFCSRKGIEALARASVIICFFVIIFLLYITLGSAFKTDMSSMNMSIGTNLLPALISLFPSAAYVGAKDKIKNDLKYPMYIYSLGIFAFSGYFILTASFLREKFPADVISKSASLSIFKAGDGLLLAVLTVSVLYIISFSGNCLCTKDSNNKQTSLFFTVIVALLSIVSLYINKLTELITDTPLVFAATVLMIAGLVVTGVLNLIKKNA